MECLSCHRQWQMEDEVAFCPFCGSPLPPRTADAPETPRSERDALHYIVMRCGKEALRDGFHVSSMLGDLIPTMTRERNILRTALSLDIVRMLLDADPRGLDMREDAMARAYRLLIDDAGMNEGAAYCAVTAFGYALDWPLIDSDSLRASASGGFAPSFKDGGGIGGFPPPSSIPTPAPAPSERHPRARRPAPPSREFTADDTKREFKGKEAAQIPAGYDRVGARAFQKMDALKSVTIPEGVSVIGERAFSACDALASVRLPDSLTALEGYAFHCCDALEAISLPASVTRVGESAFLGCTELKRVTLREGLRDIGDFAFAYCGKLPEIALPASVQHIGMLAFDSGTTLICPRGSVAALYAREHGLSHRIR